MEWRFTASFKASRQVYVLAFSTYLPCLSFLIRPADQNDIKFCVCLCVIFFWFYWLRFFLQFRRLSAASLYRFNWSASSFIYVCLPCSSTPELLIAFFVKRNEGCFYHHLLVGQRWEWRQMERVYGYEQSLLKLRNSLRFAAARDNPEICYQCFGVLGAGASQAEGWRTTADGWRLCTFNQLKRAQFLPIIVCVRLPNKFNNDFWTPLNQIMISVVIWWWANYIP